MGSFNNQIPFKIITAIFMASVFYFLMHESYSSWITSKVIQKDKKLDINYNSPTMINLIDQIHIPLNINQTKKRSQSQSESQSQSQPKRRISSDDKYIYIASDIASIVDAFYCLDLNNIGSKGIFTFGAPRVGNRHFSYLLNQAIEHRRFTHGNDHVSHFPSSSMGWKHFGTEIWIEPLGNCDCPDDPNTYWDCNFISLSIDQRNLWINSQYSEENMGCNAGQSISEVPGKLFHNGPYFGTEMGNCENIGNSLRNYQNRNNN
ncbi:hypothetical protein G9A89_001367 [Geosiphon pyriformis]|nr:hypothetical protein G9A89_001367 [Geosiphon pyriformis]